MLRLITVKSGQIKVSISLEDHYNASTIGLKRYLYAVSRNWRSLHNQTEDVILANGIHGAIGEYVVSRQYGVKWDPKIGQLGWGDIGQVEVRATTWDNGHLIGHEKEDKTDAWYVLVTGCRLDYYIAGWTTGEELKSTEFKDHFGRNRPCYAMDQSQLMPMDEFHPKMFEVPPSGAPANYLESVRQKIAR